MDGSPRVPAAALVFRAGGPQVAVVGADGRVRFRSVTIGRDDGSEVELSSGVTDGDKVVLNISSLIGDGDLVSGQRVLRFRCTCRPGFGQERRRSATISAVGRRKAMSRTIRLSQVPCSRRSARLAAPSVRTIASPRSQLARPLPGGQAARSQSRRHREPAGGGYLLVGGTRCAIRNSILWSNALLKSNPSLEIALARLEQARTFDDRV